jgi:glucan phosphoethanolaminetransferase (alkaline phosphatase superfamily)
MINSSHTTHKALQRLALDLFAWFAGPVVFLFFYTRHSTVTSQSITSHLWLMLLIWAVISVLRFATALLSQDHRTIHKVTAIAYGICFFMMLLYYPLVLTGLSAWGHVISWDLIRSYALQTPQLADALGISIPLSVGGLLLILAIIAGTSYWLARKIDWVSATVSFVPKKTLTLTLAGVLAASSMQLFGIFYFPVRDTTEPIITTFFPRGAHQQFRGQAQDTKGTEKLDQAEDATRAAYIPNPQADKKNVILIVVDALRPDHLGLYGYKRDTTPNLDRLAKEGKVRIAQSMRATCSESACGLFSLTTSKYFHEVSARPFNLHQVLKAHGYQVHLILGGDHTNFYGLRDLYGKVDSYIDGSDPSAKYANADRWVVSKAGELPAWSGTPTMLQFHLMSAHPLGEREREFKKFEPATNYSLSITRPTLKPENANNYYDNGVLQTDDVIAKLLDTLKAKRYLEDAIVAITGDHGEALGEHGEYSHAQGVREAMIRIPLVLVSYGYTPQPLSGKRVASSQVDISPTILHELAMPQPRAWHGHALQTHLLHDITHFQQGNEVGIIDYRQATQVWKYWSHLRTREEFAFELSSDPNEEKNLISQVRTSRAALWKEWRLQVLATRPVGEAR